MTSPVDLRLRQLLLLTAAVTLLAPPVANAQIADDDYLRFVPLSYPRIIRQTEATARFHLYGDPSDPTWRDVAPRDGVDDARGRWLTELSARFAPIMVRNSYQFPMDFRAFYRGDTFPLQIARWDITRSTFSILDNRSIDLAKTAQSPCPPGGDAANDDCQLLALIDQFGPNRAPLIPEATAPAELETFSTMYVDFPGYDEKTWKAAYGGENIKKYEGAATAFAHPFVVDLKDENGAAAGHELVLQYWFFYPANDGPNNHEGDWEHINVVVSPRSKVGAGLDAGTLRRLIDGTLPLDGDDPVVLKRVEYYLHHFVVPMDFSSPNVYQPRDAWEREVRAIVKAEGSNTRIYDRTRRRAYRDEAETVINTRPIVWIGGDGIGVQNVLEMPGLRDRDGHASYPFRGYYKRIGPGNVSERVIADFDHVEYFANPADERWEAVEDYGTTARITLTPDWEQVLPAILADPEARRDWAWLVLPLRFGFPASPSPVAGLIRHSDMGNVSIFGPAFNDGWNRPGDSAGYSWYRLLEASWATPLNITDSFFPRVGFLNAPIIYLMLKPPLDLAWRTVALPIRAAFGSRQPTYLPAGVPAARSVTFEVGPMISDLNDDLVTLFFTREQFPEIIFQNILNLDGELSDLKITPKFGWATAPAYSLVFHLSPRFSAESSLINYRSTIGFDLSSAGSSRPVETRGNFSQFEFHGLTRFNLMTGDFQPYVTYGHGLTFYKISDVRVDGIPISVPDSPTFRPDSGWRSLGFNETIFGAGLDWNNLRIGRTFLGVRASYSWIHHDLGFEQLAAVEDFPTLAAELAGTKFAIWRQQLRALVTVGF